MEQKPDDNKNNKKNVLRALSYLSQIGITIASCVFIGVFIGKILDNLIGSSPFMLLLFSLLGAAAAFKLIYDMGKGD